MRTSFTVILLFSLGICFSHLGQGHIASDAIRYAYIARNILASGDWFILEDSFEGVKSYFNKPHLLFWLLGLSFKALGYSTFAAKLPAALFVFASLILLWKIADLLYGERAALLSVVLFVCNRTFMRDILDLNVEGIAVCGCLLVLYAALKLVRNPTASPLRYAATLGLGVLLLVQSKTPFVLLAGFPIAMLGLIRPRLFYILKNPRFWLGLIPPLALAGAWLLLLDRSYVSGAIDNQWVNPILEKSDALENLSGWAKAFFVSWAPLSWLGLWGLYQAFRQGKVSLKRSPSDELLLLLWFSTIIPIVILIECRPRYIVVPMLALTLLAGQTAAGILRRIPLRRLQYATLLAAFLCVVIFAGFNVLVHRKNNLVLAVLENGELVEGQSPAYLCVDGDKPVRSKREAKFTELLLDLERRGVDFETEMELLPIYNSDVLPDDALAEGSLIIAERRCRKHLEEKGVSFEIERQLERRVHLLRINRT